VLQLDSTGAIPARVWITSQGREIGSAKAELHAGNNAVDVEARIAESGVNLMEVHISSAGAEQVCSRSRDRAPARVLTLRAATSFPAAAQNSEAAQVDVERRRAFR